MIACAWTTRQKNTSPKGIPLILSRLSKCRFRNSWNRCNGGGLVNRKTKIGRLDNAGKETDAGFQLVLLLLLSTITVDLMLATLLVCQIEVSLPIEAVHGQWGDLSPEAALVLNAPGMEPPPCAAHFNRGTNNR